MLKFPLKNFMSKGSEAITLGADVKSDLEFLLDECKKNLPTVNIELIAKAFSWCVNAHKDKVRKSGEAFYVHPLSVARIVVKEMPLDDISVASALMHDILNYSDLYTIKDIRSAFGSTIAEIVDNIAKIKHIESNSIIQGEQFDNYQKLLLSLFTDVRIILIKLADRLHNMRTLEFLPLDRQERIAHETLEIYSPFAHRFGLGNIKWELEDLAFKYLNRKAFDEIRSSIHGTRKEREDYIKRFTAPIKARLEKDEFLKKNNFTFDINGRPKHIYSIYNKLKARNVTIEELNDLLAVRIIIEDNEPNLCFFVYGAIAEIYPPVPGTFKNYISTPKKNGYQSIHTAVVGPGNRHVEVQIRTRKMHEIAERGLAAHFAYKKGAMPAQSILEDKGVQEWLDMVREIFENAGDETPQQLLDSVNLNLFQDEIYVFTPKHELRILPKDSTPLDFAFNIHSEIGFHCIGAKANGRIVPLSYKLQSGDQIEILASEKQKPEKEWLNFVVTSRAKTAIHKFLKEERMRIENLGKSHWDKFLSELNIKINPDDLKKVIINSRFNSIDDFYHGLGAGANDVNKAYHYVSLKLKEIELLDNNVQERSSAGDRSRLLEDFSRHQFSRPMPAVYAECCMPIPGDRIVGIIAAPKEIIVHRKECKEIREKLEKNQLNFVELSWNSLEHSKYKSAVRIIGSDRTGLLGEISAAILSVRNTNIQGISI
ncbi:MAG: diphosphokinase / guanosine-3,5-bis(diphosphate) 3-diphosphatase, partial [Bacteroidota bacterium]|nr:diphosphokinase / guanosine-3,5-bis(diphosphate) 3-diphosphatase [Bacteroidota bacterium]